MDTEIGTSRGLKYGGIPYTEILKKLEETDMGYNDEDYNDTDPDYAYRSYTRGEIVDRTLDKPTMESDKIKRDPQRSRGKLNLIYNADRGSTGELPTHPEMFMGFMDKDPRGTLLDPILANSRQYLSGGKAARMQVSMGNNDDNTIYERPWEDYKINEAKKNMLKIMRRNLKVFTQEKFGRAANNNSMADGDISKHYFADSENSMQRALYKENLTFKQKTPEDTFGIYSKVDMMTLLKEQLNNLVNKNKNSTEYQRIKHISDQMIELQGHITNMINTKNKTPEDVEKIRHMTEHMSELKDHLQTVVYGGPTPQGDFTTVQYAVELMTEMVKKDIENTNRRQKELGDIMQIHKYTDAELKPNTFVERTSVKGQTPQGDTQKNRYATDGEHNHGIDVVSTISKAIGAPIGDIGKSHFTDVDLGKDTSHTVANYKGAVPKQVHVEYQGAEFTSDGMSSRGNFKSKGHEFVSHTKSGVEIDNDYGRIYEDKTSRAAIVRAPTKKAVFAGHTELDSKIDF